MTEHHDLDGEITVLSAKEFEQLEDSDECHVREGQRHVPSFCPDHHFANVQLSGTDGILGTHTLSVILGSPFSCFGETIGKVLASWTS